MLKKFWLLFAGNICFSVILFAQQGQLVGTVSEGGTGEKLSSVTVAVKNSSIGARTDFEGDYALELNPGTYTLVYSFIGYQTQEIEAVEIKAGEATHLDIVLESQADLLDEVVVTTTARRNSEISLLNMQRNSTTLMDGLSLQSIKRSGASTIATAVRSVPGVSVQDGKYVYVRGLGDRYTKSVLNGMDIPGLDPDKNTIQMDIFPTNILENIVVVKSASAELPADFTGGVVDIVTKDFPAQEQFGASISVGYNPQMHFNDRYLSYSGGSTDFLGFDDGTRKMPISAGTTIPHPASSNNGTLEGITRSFDPTMAAQPQTSMPDFSVGLNYANQYDVKGNKLGLLLSLDYKNSTEFYDGFENGVYQRWSERDRFDLRDNRRQYGNLGTNNVLGSVLAGLSYKTSKSKYMFNVLHIQNGESRAAFFDQSTRVDNVINVVKDNLEYSQRSVSNVLISGKHANEDASFTTEWKISPTLSKINDKDVRLTTFIDGGNGTYTIGSDAGFPLRIWRDLDEVNLVGKVDFVKKHQFLGDNSTLKFGALYSYKARDYSIQSYEIAPYNTITSALNGDPDALLADENVWTPEGDSGYFIRGNFQPANTYDATQQVGALYVSNEFRLLEKLQAVIGLRGEFFMANFTGQNNLGDEVYDNENVLDKIDLFPSANLIYGFTENNKFRLSYSRTTARPTFRELSVVQIPDLLTGIMFLGNIDLQPTYINNFDIRYELFGDNAQMFAVSGFYKRFKDPIEIVAYSEIDPSQFTPRNAPAADVVGVEIEARKHLGFISDGLSDLSINVNASLIQSRIEMLKGAGQEYDSRLNAARDGEEIEDTRELQGQSPYLINTGLLYNNEDLGLETGLFYNVQGKTLEVIGLSVNPDVYTQPFNSLNFNFSKKVGQAKKGTISLKVENILNDDRESLYESFRAESQRFQLRSPGRNFSLGYSYSF
ncbi:TonB-dependent receptor domain-containing protein [Parapedobacter sp. DT-150]|uniref:TonB-dependent receptor n=1 Tax=Parapedobacter sp. DT-150 TaxID=3396162 RepID=UPI003F19B4D6